MVADKKNLLLLFDRPLEPIFAQKGVNKAVFELPPNLLTDRYKSLGVQFPSRFSDDSGESITVNDITPPNLSEVLELKRDENFTLFLPKHRRIAKTLIDIFLNAKDIDELQSIACYCRDRVNPYLFHYCYSVALLHRPDTKGTDIPNLVENFPDKYLNSQVFVKAREEASIIPDGSRIPIEIPMDYTASDLETEHRLAYFREDLGINLHHWHWHLVYPFNGPAEVVNKDRRGELFYFFHHQVIARYNVERLCNSMRRVERFINWQETVTEGYYPKLESIVANRAYPARPANMKLQDVNREQDQWKVDVQDMELFRSRIFEAIHSGSYRDAQNNLQPLTEFGGIDVLGNIMEASDLSPNSSYYGDLHNFGHLMFSVIHDPDYRHRELFGVIGDPATAMRDPIFYRWHAFVDDVFLEFKSTLPRYTISQLSYEGVNMVSVKVVSPNSANNVINTFWQQSDVDMQRGLDFQPRGPVFVRFTHLNHMSYNYEIRVNNTGGQRQGTCRIFLSPKFDERGTPWALREQKEAMIEMDRFVVNLNPGQNVITQSSSQSSVTIPFERTFRNLELGRPIDPTALEQFNFCGCGWPQHMLVPKGTVEGYACQLFVMISDIEGDRVNQSIEGPCNDAAVFCGINGGLYPDRRSMGYPFDRMPRDGVESLQDFLTPNMMVTDLTIRHHQRTVRPKTRI